MPDWSAIGVGLNALVVVIGAAYLFGQWRERLDLKDWWAWRRGLVQQIKTLERDTRVDTLKGELHTRMRPGVPAARKDPR
jgi:hypothetical protein